MLFVDHYHTQLCELHSILDDGVRAHQNLHLASEQSVQDVLSLFAFHNAGEQFHAYRHILQESLDGLQMLLCQDLRRCHDTGLKTIVQRDEHCHERHQRLAAAHVALQQAVHLSAGTHVLTDFMHHPFLGSRQRERQVLTIKRIEDAADAVEYISAILAALVAGIAKDVQLHEKQFLELHSETRLLQVFRVLRIVNGAQRLVATHQVEWGSDEVGYGLWQRVLEGAEERLRQFLDGARVHARLLHLLRGIVVRLHTHRRRVYCRRIIDVGMRYLYAIVIDGRLAEHHILCANLVFRLGSLAELKPHEVHDTRTIGEVGHHTFVARAHLKGLETQYSSHHLHERHVACEFVNGVDPRAIHIFIRVILEQVAKGQDAQLLVEHLFAVGAHARQVHDVLIEYVHLDECLCYFEVERRRYLDVLTITLDDGYLVAIGLNYRGVICKTLLIGLTIGSLQ